MQVFSEATVDTSLLPSKKRKTRPYSCRPVLGSTLLRHRSGSEAGEQLPAPIKTGWGAEIDAQVLELGLRGVVSVAIGEAEVALEMQYATIASTLITHQEARVFLLSTPNYFSPKRLHQHLCKRIEINLNQKSKQAMRANNDSPDILAQAQNAMERAQLLPVLTLEGCIQAVEEVAQSVRQQPDKVYSRQNRAQEIADSQEPSSAEDDDDDEEVPERPALLLLATLPQLLSTQMRRNHIRAHAQLVTLLRCLTRLCSTVTHLPQRTTNRCSSLIVNTTVAGPSSSGDVDPHASIFAVNAGLRPALGRTFGHFIDVSLLVSRVPVNRAASGRGGVDVLEVCWDKCGGATGRWGVLGLPLVEA